MFQVHPGEVLSEEMETRGLNPNSLALKLRTNRQAISEIVAQARGISAEMALRLGYFFGTGPEFWANLQTAYDLAVARREVGAKIAKEVEAA